MLHCFSAKHKCTLVCVCESIHLCMRALACARVGMCACFPAFKSRSHFVILSASHSVCLRVSVAVINFMPKSSFGEERAYGIF